MGWSADALDDALSAQTEFYGRIEPTMSMRELLEQHGRAYGEHRLAISFTDGSWAPPWRRIDVTYGHLVPDSEEYLRGLLDAFDAPKQAVRGLAGD